MKTFQSLALITGLAFLTINTSAQEQSGPNPQNMAQKMTAAVKQNVTGITPDQETKILAIETDFAKGMIDARNNAGDDHDAMRTKMKPLKEARDTKMKAILTDDQYAQYQKVEAAKAGRRGGN